MKFNFPSSEAYDHAAWMLGVERNALMAIGEVESGAAGAFNSDGTPVVLFERHIFDRLTGGRYRGARVFGADTSWSAVSEPSPGGYGPSRVQHERLDYAATLDRSAALRATSWGLFQILGSNCVEAGFRDLQSFINAMYRDVDEHLRALVMFIRSNSLMLEALREKNWAEFARRYNGPDYQKNRWDVKAAEAYERLK